MDEKKAIEVADLHLEDSHEVAKNSALRADDELEHQLTVAYVVKHHKTLIWWTFYWAMCAVGWGFDAQVNGAMISVPAFRRDFGYIFEGEAVLPARWQTAFNVISTPGQLIGGFLCSSIADSFGRKNSLLIGIILCTGGIIGQLFSATRIAFLCSKLVLGFGLGFYLTIGPLCTSEVAPVVLRGIATAGVNLGIAIGQLLSNAAVAGFGERDDHWAYRGPFALQLLFAVFLLVLLPFAPESPWWLVKKGKTEQAKKALEKLYGANVDIDNKLAALQSTVSNETRDGEVNFMDCFKGTNRIRTFISMGVFACQHLVGIIFVLGYSTYFFQLAGLDDSNSFGLGVGVTACGVTGNLVSWFVINNVGRRKLFVGGMVALTAMLLLIGIMDVVPTAGAKWAQSAITVVWAFVYFMTIGAMAFAILGETSNTSLRAHTAALATATQAVFGLAMNFAIPYMVNPDEGNLKGKVGFIFGGLGALATIWAWFFVPELKGRTFDEIDRMFSDRIPPRKMGTHVLL
ncbi:putative maltose permease [Aureobasidium pullulans]|nr:putative maltose permease [Aureobasidium pullulans]THX77485.1 putative maltose permease [Aureobasidium pullulans]THZ07253.1 putative maltose permease [Aureobasidium pullulans]TIA12806.1 putative maltose permease [Aureobasidium pullulans]